MNQMLKEISEFNSEWKEALEDYFQKTKEKIDRILELSLEPLNLSVEDFKKLNRKEFLKLARGKLKIDFIIEEICGERDRKFILINDIVKVDYYNNGDFDEVIIESLLDLRNYDERFSDSIEGFVSWFQPFEK